MVTRGAEEFSLGQGDHALLMIHGWGSSPRDFRTLAKSLSDQYHCRAPRLYGHGTQPRDLDEYDWQQHLLQITEEFSQLALTHSKVSVIGFSYGGALSLHLAARRRVSQLVLIAPFYHTPLWKGLVRPDRLVPYLPRFIKSLSKRGPGPILDPDALKEHIHYTQMPLQSLRSVVQCAKATDNIIQKVQCPSFILHSVRDATASFDGGVHYLKYLGARDKTLAAFNRSNHVLTLDYDKTEVLFQINRWLRSRL